MRSSIAVALCAMLAACSGGPAGSQATSASSEPPVLTGDAAAGEAMFKSYPDIQKRAVICAGFYRSATRFANNPVEDVPGNLAFWNKRIAEAEPAADKQTQLSTYADTMTKWSFTPGPGGRFLDSLQLGANYEGQLNHCARDRQKFEGANAG